MLALLHAHGVDPASWPADVRRGAVGASATRTGTYRSLFGLDAAGYRSHAVHGSGRTYMETNCYTDIIIELLHGRGDEPLAVLGCR